MKPLAKNTSPSTKVVIGIPTCKRPVGLNNLLKSIAELSVTDIELIILVADNDAELKQGMKVVAELKQEYKYHIEAICVEQRGISYVRNKLLYESFETHQADFLAMIDDDELVEGLWLNELLKTQKNTQCDVVGGVVVPKFPSVAPDWVSELSIYYPRNPNESIEIPLIEGVGNVLLNKAIYFEFSKQRFDPFYSVYGGGDKEYFTRLKAGGARFALAHKAVSYELFDESRVTKSWAIERAHRIGAADMRIILKHHKSFLKLCIESCKVIFATLLGLLMYITPINSEAKKMKGRLLLARQIGKIAGLFNKQKAVYKKVHGG